MIRKSLRSLAIAGIALAALTLGACGGGHTRGMFQGYVMGKTEAEIVDKVGKPAEVDRANPERPVLVYKAKTFDPDNQNRVDPETAVYLRKTTDGQFVADDVSFRG